MKDFDTTGTNGRTRPTEYINALQASEILGVSNSALSVRSIKTIGDDILERLGGRKNGTGRGTSGPVEYPTYSIRKIQRVMQLGFNFAAALKIVAYEDELTSANMLRPKNEADRYQCYAESIRAGFEPKDALIRARNFS